MHLSDVSIYEVSDIANKLLNNSNCFSPKVYKINKHLALIIGRVDLMLQNKERGSSKDKWTR